jgi:hypothetical protein
MIGYKRALSGGSSGIPNGQTIPKRDTLNEVGGAVAEFERPSNFRHPKYERVARAELMDPRGY